MSYGTTSETVTPSEVRDRNARHAFYSHLSPGVDLHRWALDQLGLRGDESIVDVGCGSGRYLETLWSQGHRGPTIGVDISAAMLDIARSRLGTRSSARGDARALPMPMHCADVVLLMHVLYDIEERDDVIDEVRRVMKPDGLVAVSLNSGENLSDLNELVLSAARDVDVAMRSLGWNYLNFPAERADGLLRQVFASVVRHDTQSHLLFSEVAPVLEFLCTSPAVAALPQPEGQAVMRAVTQRIGAVIRSAGQFRVRVLTHCFVCCDREDRQVETEVG